LAETSDFVANVLDLLASWGGVSARRMFGGYGLYRQGLMFALVADDVLYLKADDGNRAAFEEAGTKPFTYDGKSKPVTMSYWEAPPDLFDEPEAMRAWARRAFEAALRANALKARGKSRGQRITKS
jgi:DNA transformation protein and related proteins